MAEQCYSTNEAICFQATMVVEIGENNFDRTSLFAVVIIVGQPLVNRFRNIDGWIMLKNHVFMTEQACWQHCAPSAGHDC